MQFAGYLHGRALQEWNLISQIEHSTYNAAISEIRNTFRFLLSNMSEAQSCYILLPGVLNSSEGWNAHFN